ncbi:MAG TPA: hypothetical protein VHQ65_00660 [Thermoanaerobaculia bacterium]|nr:hypothetical protein [Thermoanaerobaculia bacterium]
MGKKVLLGCFVAFLVAVVGGGIVFYQFVYKPGREMVRAGVEQVQGFARLGELEEMNADIENRSGYTPPADAELTTAQVERFLAVHRSVREALGPRWQQLEQSWNTETGPNPGESGSEPGLGDVLAFWRDVGDVATEAKRAQVAALNAHDFSQQEYEWVRKQVYLALGSGAVAVSLDEVARAVREGGLTQLEDLSKGREALERQAPQHNVELVEPHREELQAWAPLAFLGL